MAIALDQKLGSSFSGVGGTTLALVTVQPVAAGAWVFVAVQSDNAVSVDSLSEGAHNYAKDITLNNASATITIFSFYYPAGLSSGATLTVTFGAPTTRKSMCAASFTGITSPLPLDVTASHGIFTPAWDGGTTALTAQADELVLGAAACNNGGGAPTNAPGGGYIDLYGAVSVTGVDATVAFEYLIVAAQGTQSAVGTWSVMAGGDVAAVTATYKAGSGPSGGPSPQAQMLGVGALGSGFTRS